VSTSRAIAGAREDVVAIDELTGSIMTNVCTFRIDVEVENPARPGERRRVECVLGISHVRLGK
jgi:hypothetical protein